MPNGLPTIAAQRPAKWWARSRTLIVNAIALALAAAELQLGLLRPVLGDSVYIWLAFALPVINAALRADTKCALTLHRPRSPVAAGPSTAPGADPTASEESTS